MVKKQDFVQSSIHGKISFKKIYISEQILWQIIGDKGSLKPMGFAKIPVAAAAVAAAME